MCVPVGARLGGRVAPVFWFQKAAALDYHWTVWVGTLAQVSAEAVRLGVIRKGKRTHGCYDPETRRIYVTGPEHFLHEWQHVVFTVWGIGDGHERRNGRAHRAIVEIDEAARWIAKRPPPPRRPA